jgi:hypothetical protein
VTNGLTFDHPRRAWEANAFNRLARFVQRLGISVGTLSEQSLLETARRRTGLSDFGNGPFLGALRMTLTAFHDDMDANPMGRVLARHLLLSGLCNRLWIQDALRRHPEICREAVVRPLIIVGWPRTGSTLLHRLLAQDPASRPLLTWETMLPAPRPQEEGKRQDPRIRRAGFDLWRIHRLAPRFRAVHPIGLREPEECMMLLRNTFVWAGGMALPSYWRWYLTLPRQTRDTVYQEYFRQLQLLQWQRRPRSHLLLKAPEHLWSLSSLIKVLPDACLVQIHRDPFKVIPSLCSQGAILHGMFSDHVRPQRIGPQVLEACVYGISRRDLCEQELGPLRVLDIQYRDLVRDPLETVSRIYRHFGYGDSEEFARRARRWLHDMPKRRHNRHVYRLEQFGLSRDDLDSALSSYCRRYEIEPED